MGQDNLTIRPFEARDAEAVAGYWRDQTPEDLERMGVARDALPPYDAMVEGLRRSADPGPEPRAFCLIWEISGEAVGFCTLKDIEPKVQGGMHLHMWNKAARGQGHGARLFCMSAIEFYERFGLARIHCDPKAANPMPNAMLKKIGFELLETFWGRSSALSEETELNRYLVDPEVARAYLSRCR